MNDDIQPSPWWSVPDESFRPDVDKIGFGLVFIAAGAWMGQEYYATWLNGVILTATLLPVLHFGWYYTMEIGEDSETANDMTAVIWLSVLVLMITAGALSDTHTDFARLNAVAMLGLTALLLLGDYIGYLPGPLGPSDG